MEKSEREKKKRKTKKRANIFVSKLSVEWFLHGQEWRVTHSMKKKKKKTKLIVCQYFFAQWAHRTVKTPFVYNLLVAIFIWFQLFYSGDYRQTKNFPFTEIHRKKIAKKKLLVTFLLEQIPLWICSQIPQIPKRISYKLRS